MRAPRIASRALAHLQRFGFRGLGVLGFGFWVESFGFRVLGLGVWVKGFGFWILGLGVEEFGFRV